MISVIIPTYNAPEYLDLCIKSAVQGKRSEYPIEIVVVVDGTHDINKSVLDKWKDNINPIIFEENMGLMAATNHGIYNASNDKILVVNDDNVFPKEWDTILMEDFQNGYVLTPNQMEPNKSMFWQFYHNDMGKTAKEFDVDAFQTIEQSWRQNSVDNCGSTLPFMMSKMDYLKIGGWDESYPNGNVVDWDFFLKCNLAGYKMKRTYKCCFYHFGSVTFKSPEKILESQQKEQQGFEYFKYKWGTYPKHDPMTNLKSI